MTDTNQKQLGNTLWSIADQLRGAMDADDFRDYMLSSLFLRYLSDTYETAAKIEESLKRQSGFSGAKKGEEKKVGEVLQFTMTIPLGEAEGEEPAAGGGEG